MQYVKVIRFDGKELYFTISFIEIEIKNLSITKQSINEKRKLIYPKPRDDFEYNFIRGRYYLRIAT